MDGFYAFAANAYIYKKTREILVVVFSRGSLHISTYTGIKIISATALKTSEKSDTFVFR